VVKIMLYSICYDISDDRRRNRVASILLGFGERVQYSVFEADLDIANLERLVEKVAPEMKEDEDNLRIYPICEQCRSKIQIMGYGQVTQYPDVIII